MSKPLIMASAQKFRNFKLLGGVGGGLPAPGQQGAPVSSNKIFANAFSYDNISFSTSFNTYVPSSYVRRDALELITYSMPNSGVTFNLHPTVANLTALTDVYFCIPFPVGVCTSVKTLTILDENNNEVATTVEPLLYWRDYDSNVRPPRSAYIRSVLVRMQIQFPTATPKLYRFKLSDPRQLEGNYTFALSTAQVPIQNTTFFNDEYNVSENVTDPLIIPEFSTDWLCKCNFNVRPAPITPLNARWAAIEQNEQIAGYSYPTNGGGTYAGDTEAFPRIVQFGKSLVNDVRPHVVSPTHTITYEGVGNYEPWLYDRAMSLWNLYIRTGSPKWFRHANRATQFYSKHIGVTGYFDLRADDIKYSYGQSMLVGQILTGENYSSVIERATLPAINSFNETYTYVAFTGANSIPGWTERNTAYALQTCFTAWEITGLQTYKDRVDEIINALIFMQNNPQNGWTYTGSFLHSIMSHEGGTGGGTGNEGISSPWMSAILIDVLFKIYIQTNNESILTCIRSFGDYYKNYGTYLGSEGIFTGLRIPWYISGADFTYTDSGTFGDVEHVPDVLGAIAKCMFAQKYFIGSVDAGLLSIYNDLRTTLDVLIPYWIRTGQATIDNGQTLFRVAPPRKFGWWFNSATDLTFLDEAING